MICKEDDPILAGNVCRILSTCIIPEKFHLKHTANTLEWIYWILIEYWVSEYLSVCSIPILENENSCFHFYKFVIFHISLIPPIVLHRDTFQCPVCVTAIFLIVECHTLRLTLANNLFLPFLLFACALALLLSLPLSPFSFYPDKSMSFSWFIDSFSYFVCISLFPLWATLQRNCEIPPSLWNPCGWFSPVA